MELKINKSITLSPGNTSSGTIVELFNENFILSEKKFRAGARAWISQTVKDAGKEHVYLYNSSTVYDIDYDIPQADLDQAITDGHFGVIGTNHPTRIKDAMAAIVGGVAADIEITSLV